MKRREVTYDGKGIISVEEGDVPEVNENEVLVEVHTSLISPGTEMGSVKNLRARPSSSMEKRAFGYGNAGVVLKCGKGCVRLKEGMRVACMGGTALHSDYAVVPVNLCIPIPENVSFEEASFAHLGATSLQAIRRADLQFGENVLIAGLGIIGNIAGQISNLSGCHTLGMDLFQLRRELAIKMGFDRVVDPKNEDLKGTCTQFTRGYGMDCAFMCFGGDGTEVFKKILEVMKIAPDTHKWGRVVIPGGCTVTTMFGSVASNVDLRSSARTGPGYHDPEYEHGKDYPLVFVPWSTQRNLEEIIRAISEKKISVEPLITHRFPILRAPEACDLLIENPQSSLGVILNPREK